MKLSPLAFLALANVAPLAFIMPANAAAPVRDTGAENAVKIIAGQVVVRTKCEWHNFFQSVSMWPKYRICPGKNAQESYGFYASGNAPSSVLDVFLKLNPGQESATRDDFVRPLGSNQLTFRIGAKEHSASVCDWYNLFQSRYRTPYYLKCDGRSNRESFGRYSEPDYPEALGDDGNNPRRAPDIFAFLSGPPGSTALNLRIGAQSYTRSFCEWHNFYQSFNPLPRFIVCNGNTRSESFGQYLFGQNIVALKVKSQANGDSTSKGFGEIVSFQLGAQTITAQRCALYNWLQSNIRWPVYRGCGAIRQYSFTNADPRIFPKGDRRYLFNQNYTD